MLYFVVAWLLVSVALLYGSTQGYRKNDLSTLVILGTFLLCLAWPIAVLMGVFSRERI